MSVWDSITAAATSAAKATEYNANRAQLSAQIMYAQNNLQTAKKEFGLLAYDYYAKDQEEALRTHFESFKVQIDQIEEDIKSKQIALDYLDSEYNGMSPAGATPPPAFGGTSDASAPYTGTEPSAEI